MTFLWPPQDVASASCVSASIESVYDGDTVTAVFQGKREKVRLLGIDSPELNERARCPAEQAGARRARDRLRNLVTASRDRQVCPQGRDRYDRVLAVLLLDGRDASGLLIAEGLGRPDDGGERSGWCD